MTERKMGPEQKRLMDRLFGDPNCSVRNFHITPGDQPSTAEEICEQVNKAMDEVERRRAAGEPDDGPVRPVVLVEDDDDDDYIPFEGPLWATRGPRKMSQSEIDSLKATVARIRQRRLERANESWRKLLAQGKGPRGPATELES